MFRRAAKAWAEARPAFRRRVKAWVEALPALHRWVEARPVLHRWARAWAEARPVFRWRAKAWADEAWPVLRRRAQAWARPESGRRLKSAEFRESALWAPATRPAFRSPLTVRPPALPTRSVSVPLASMVRVWLASRVPENRYFPFWRAITHTGSCALNSTCSGPVAAAGLAALALAGKRRFGNSPPRRVDWRPEDWRARVILRCGAVGGIRLGRVLGGRRLRGSGFVGGGRGSAGLCGRGGGGGRRLCGRGGGGCVHGCGRRLGRLRRGLVVHPLPESVHSRTNQHHHHYQRQRRKRGRPSPPVAYRFPRFHARQVDFGLRRVETARLARAAVAEPRRAAPRPRSPPRPSPAGWHIAAQNS